MDLIVVGASGYLGEQIFIHGINKGWNVIGTVNTRLKSDFTNSKLFKFDLLNDDILKIVRSKEYFKTDKRLRCAVICAAMTSIDTCFENKEKAFDCNFVKTLETIKRLSSEGYKIIVFSTDNVFDGKSGDYTEESPLSPINTYGETKARLEAYLLSNNIDACIMRLGKVIDISDNSHNMLGDLYFRLMRNEETTCIRGLTSSYTYMKDLLSCIDIAIQNNMKGLYNIVGNEIYTRRQFTEVFARALNIKDNIVEKELKDFNFKDKRPLNIGLNNKKFIQETGFSFTSLDAVFKAFTLNINN